MMVSKKMKKSKPNKKSIVQPALSQHISSSKGRLKTYSMIIIAIFIAIVLIGAVMEYLSGRESVKPTEAQIASARALIASSLQKNGDDISNYKVSFAKRLIPLRKQNMQAKALHACLYSRSVKHFYLIDAGSQSILGYSKTEFYNSFKNSKDMENENGCHFPFH